MVRDVMTDAANYKGADPVGVTAAQLFNNKIDVSLIFASTMQGTDAKVALKAIGLVTAVSKDLALDLVRASTARVRRRCNPQVAQLYVLFQNRAPEKSGLAYWA